MAFLESTDLKAPVGSVGALLYRNHSASLRRWLFRIVYNAPSIIEALRRQQIVTAINPFPTPDHNHKECVRKALQTADEICRARGLRLTKTRLRVLELVWNSHKPVGAYDILESLASDGKRAAPPTVYRALEFLIDARLVHRLDSLNAFIGCQDPRHSHEAQFLICRDCRSVAELEDEELTRLVREKAISRGFSAVRQTLEIQGLCRDCRQAQ